MMKSDTSHSRRVLSEVTLALFFSVLAYRPNVNADGCKNLKDFQQNSCSSLYCSSSIFCNTSAPSEINETAFCSENEDEPPAWFNAKTLGPVTTLGPVDTILAEKDPKQRRKTAMVVWNSTKKLMIKHLGNLSDQSKLSSAVQNLRHVLSDLEDIGPVIGNSLNFGEVVTETQPTLESFFTKTDRHVSYVAHQFSDGSEFGLSPMNSFNTVITGNDSSVGVCSFYLKNIDNLMSSFNDSGKAGGSVADDFPQTVINTQVIAIAVSFGDVTVHNLQLSENISLTLKLKHTQNMTQPACVSFDAENLRPTFSGCYTQQLNSTHVRCLCSHLTYFAVMMKLEMEEANQSGVTESDRVLVILTSICLSLSCFFLLLAFMTSVGFSKLRQIRYFILANLSLSLGLAQFLYLVGNDQVSDKVVCAVIAGFLHFLFLAAFCWMGVEGLEIYMKLIVVYQRKRSMVPIYILIGYGVPTIIVAVSAGVRFDGYGTKTSCWLSSEGWFHLAFIVPVIVIIIWNTVMLFVAMIVMGRHLHKSSKKKEKERNAMKKQIKGAVSLAGLLGVTWLFGLLQVNDILTIVFSYIFVLLNGTQGVIVYVFQCLFNSQVIAEYYKVISKSRIIPECCKQGVLNLLYKGLDSSTDLATSHQKSIVAFPSYSSYTVSKPKLIIQPRENVRSELTPSDKNITFLSKEVEIPDTPTDIEAGVYLGEPDVPKVISRDIPIPESTGITIEEAGIYMGEPSSTKEKADTESKAPVNVSDQDSKRTFSSENAEVSSDVKEKHSSISSTNQSLGMSGSLVDDKGNEQSISILKLYLPASFDSQAE